MNNSETFLTNIIAKIADRFGVKLKPGHLFLIAMIIAMANYILIEIFW